MITSLLDLIYKKHIGDVVIAAKDLPHVRRELVELLHRHVYYWQEWTVAGHWHRLVGTGIDIEQTAEGFIFQDTLYGSLSHAKAVAERFYEYDYIN